MISTVKTAATPARADILCKGGALEASTASIPVLIASTTEAFASTREKNPSTKFNWSRASLSSS